MSTMLDTSFQFGCNVSMDCSEMAGRLTDWDAVRKFIFAGNAYITIRSAKTGVRFTFRVKAKKSSDDGRIIHFVSLLRGPSNEDDFAYMGCIIAHTTFSFTQKSRVTAKALSAKAWLWLFDCMIHDKPMSPSLEIWHEGRCGVCGRRLTVPESVSTGYGPECLGRL